MIKYLSCNKTSTLKLKLTCYCTVKSNLCVKALFLVICHSYNIHHSYIMLFLAQCYRQYVFLLFNRRVAKHTLRFQLD